MKRGAHQEIPDAGRAVFTVRNASPGDELGGEMVLLQIFLVAK